MALILTQQIGDKRCWSCGRIIETGQPAVTLTAAMEVIYLHPLCARNVAQRIFGDIGQLTDFGYEIEELWEPK